MSATEKNTLHFRSHTISFRGKKKKKKERKKEKKERKKSFTKGCSKDSNTQMKLIAQEGWGTK